VARRLRIDAGAGSSQVRTSSEATTTTHWLHGGFDLEVGGRTWIAVSGETRAASRGNQVSVLVGQRF
jgi:hypothetical protein